MSKMTIREYPYTNSGDRTWDGIFSHPVEISVTELNAGNFEAERTVFLNKKHPDVNRLKNAGDRVIAPIFFYLLRHKKLGDILIDTGLDRSFQKTEYGNYSIMARLFHKLMKVRIIQKYEETMDYHIDRNGIKPGKVFFTHLSADHTSGVPALPVNIEYVVSKSEVFSRRMRLISSKSFKGKKAMEFVDFDKGQRIPPFEKAADVLGDASLWALFTPGHSPGHMSFLVNSTNGPVLIAGDALIDKESYEYGIEPFCVGRLKDATESLEAIKEFMKQYPETKLLISHNAK
jgi:N-acyl homoserine lactone hydrolase